jgi:hypothetical protein
VRHTTPVGDVYVHFSADAHEGTAAAVEELDAAPVEVVDVNNELRVTGPPAAVLLSTALSIVARSISSSG